MIDASNNNLLCLSEDWGRINYNDEIVVYGTGRIGRRVLPSLMKEFRIPFLIDNKDSGNQVCGINVVNIYEGISLIKSNKIKGLQCADS